jgi:hypothetical protein
MRSRPPSCPYGGTTTAYTRVVPEVVVEVSTDPAVDGRRWRHPVRFLRVRTDLAAADLTVEPRTVQDGA